MIEIKSDNQDFDDRDDFENWPHVRWETEFSFDNDKYLFTITIRLTYVTNDSLILDCF